MPERPERVALSQELSEFLIEFSIALHRTSMYPWGHPSLERAAATVLSRLSRLLADRPSLSIGVARRQLVIEGVATDPRHPVLRSLAEKLHRHHLGAVAFYSGVRTDEVIAMMRLVGVEPGADVQPLGLDDPDRLRQWDGVRLYALTYEQLQLIGESDEEEDEDRDRGTRTAQLWIGLARAALATDGGDIEPESTEPAVVAKAINEHPEAKAYDQVIVGYLLQLAQELKQEGGPGAVAVRRRLSRLIDALDPGTLERLVRMGGDFEQRRRFVLDATEALAADAVVEIVQAAAASTEQTISNSMVRLLTKLSAFAEQGERNVQLHADTALREQVQQLMENWQLRDPNPDAYTRALESLATRAQSTTTTAHTQFAPEPIRIVHMALEVDAVGIPFWRAVAEVLHSDGLKPLIHALESVAEDNQAAIALWDHLATAERIVESFAREPVDFVALGKLLDRMDDAVVARILFEQLRNSESRATRMGAFKRLAMLPVLVLEPYLLAGLRDERWYVQRNMLALLNEADAYSETIGAAAFARHPDVRVRREALILWMRSPYERDRAIAVTLTDQDERAVRAAIAEARVRFPDAATPVLARRIGDPALAPELRAEMALLLNGTRNPVVLEALLRLVTAGKTLFGKVRLAAPTPDVLAALTVLANTWADEPRAAELIERARRSTDPAVRATLDAAGNRS